MLKQAHYTIIILLFWSSFFYGQECTGGITSYPYTQGFENTFGSWTQSATDDLDWSLLSGATPSSNTGPSAAYAGSYYIYVEASGNGTGYPNKRAIITSPCYDLSVLSDASFNFYYHMYGSSNMGTIALEISTDDGGSWTSIWSQSGNLGNQWNPQVSIDLSTYIGGSVQFRFNRFTDSTWQADIAIDNVSITGTEIPTPDGYLGPGGVGHTDGTSDLELWLMADKDVASNGSSVVTGWLDNSGNGNDVSTIGGDPTYSATINGYEVISLDGTDHFLSNVASNTSTKASTYVAATITGDNDGANGWGGVLSGSKSGQLDWDNTDHVVFLSRNGDTSNLCAQRDGTKSSFTDGIVPNSNVKIMGSEFNGSNSIVRFNGSAAAAVTSSDAFNFNLIGIGKRITESKYTIGNYGEVIYFSKEINLAKKIIIENYLQAKYDGTIDASIDFYDEDTSGENFDHKVAGIGQASDGSNHTDSQGTGIVRINTPSALSNGDFLFWGEDVKDATYEYASSTDYLERLNTKWRVSKVGDLGTVSLSFKDSDIDLSGYNCGDLNLIVSNSSTFATKTSYTLTLSAGIYTATEVNFTDGDYFTIEYRDLIVVDGTQFYNGSNPVSNVPNTTDDCYKLLVKSTATGALTLTEDADVREVEVEAGGKLVLDTNTRLQITNNIQLDGDIRLVGSSQLIQTHTGGAQITGSGNLYIDQDSDLTSVYRYNYWSSPVKEIGSSQYTVAGVMKDGTTATSATSTPADLNFTTGYDGSLGPLTLSSYWIYGYLNGDDGAAWSQKGELGTFNPGEGYLLKSPGAAQNYTFKGTPNDGDISFTIDADKTSLLGNPYPSAIDANQLFIDSSNLATLYFWEHKNEETTGDNNEGHYGGGYVGGYSYRNATMGTAADADVEGTAGLGGGTYTAPGRYIAVGQGFFAETAAGVAATVNFKNSQRFFETEAGDSHFFRSTSKKEEVTDIDYSILKFGFEAKNNEGDYIHSQVGISFSEGKTFSLEAGFDSRKAEIKDSDIYFQFNDSEEKLVIAGVEEITDNLIVPITLKIDTSEDIFIMLDEKKNINNEVFILDASENIFYNIANPIQLNLAKGTYNNRFFITFKSKTLTVEENLFDKDFSVFQDISAKELIIKNVSSKTIKNISLYTLTGKRIVNINNKSSLQNNEIRVKTNRISTSVYIAKITTEAGVVTKKIFIE